MAKQYLIFQRGFQPTEWELNRLNSFRGVLGGYKVGREESTGWLAIEFDAKKFEAVCDESTFLTLLTNWRQHGCIRRPHLKFTVDDSALKPKRSAKAADIPEVAPKSLVAKHYDANLSLGIAGLARYKLLRQMEMFAGSTKWVVPGLVALTITLAVVGYWRIEKALNRGNIESNFREQKRQFDELLLSNPPIPVEIPEPTAPLVPMVPTDNPEKVDGPEKPLQEAAAP